MNPRAAYAPTGRSTAIRKGPTELQRAALRFCLQKRADAAQAGPLAYARLAAKAAAERGG
ncbi:hypothetical protein GCM10028821_20770 [Hymenobacter jeollabukensis]